MSLQSVGLRRGTLFAILSAAVSLLGVVPGTSGAASEDAEPLVLGESHEHAITPPQAHVYRIAVPSAASLRIAVEQQGIDLVVEARLADQPPVTIDSPNSRWGPEVLLLTAPGALEIRLEVRSSEPSGLPGSYRILAEELPAATDEDKQRTAAEAAMTRGGQGSFVGTPEARRQALAAYREALSAWRALGDRRGQAEALSDIADLEWRLGDRRPALTDARQALELWREIGEPHREAAAVSQAGFYLLDLGEVATTRDSLEQARDLWQRLDQPFEVEEANRGLCSLEQSSGSLPKALACFQDVLPRVQQLGDRSQEANVLNSLGGIYDLLGEPDAALEHYGRALALRTALKNLDGEVQILNNLAVVHRGLGEWQEALRLYGQAREILAQLEDRGKEASLLNNLGFFYHTLGEPERALPLLQQSLALRRATGDRRGEVIVLNNLGLAYVALAEPDKALALHRQALDIAVALGDGRQEAVTRLRMGEAELAKGDFKVAQGELQRAFELSTKLGNQRLATQALSLEGRALARSRRPREALPLLTDALAHRRALRDRPGEAETLQDLVLAERAGGLAPRARAHASEAVALVDDLRRGFITPNLRAAFLATQRRAYELQIELLMDRQAADSASGNDREALAISERARARTLLDSLYQGGTGDHSGSLPVELREHRNALRRRLSVKAYQQQLLADRPGDGKAEALVREIDDLLTDLDGVEAEIRRLDPRYATFSEPPVLGATEIAALLEPGTLLLEYSLGEEKSFVWAVSAGSCRSFSLPSGGQIGKLARQVHNEMSRQESGAVPPRQAANALSRLLLAPLWKLAAGARRLVVVPDGALHYVPFAALPVPLPGQGWGASDREPLLLRHEVVFLPSATTLAVQRQRLSRRPPAPHQAAVLADPVFGLDDPRLARAGGAGPKVSQVARGELEGMPRLGFERLGASRQEAEALVGLAPAGEVRAMLGFAASRQTVLSGELGSYRILHFATHGLIDPRHPELSGLVLSQLDSAGRPVEGFLRLADVYDLDLRADLVVLSGCQTALGKEVRGEGLMGMTRGFLYAGVPRVVGSLWRVEDRASVELMSRFYRALWQEKRSPAAALREAQLALRQEKRYRDPHSWAAFVLQGEWR